MHKKPFFSDFTVGCLAGLVVALGLSSLFSDNDAVASPNWSTERLIERLVKTNEAQAKSLQEIANELKRLNRK